MRKLIYLLICTVFLPVSCSPGRGSTTQSNGIELSTTTPVRTTESSVVDQGNTPKKTLEIEPAPSQSIGPEIYNIKTNVPSYLNGVIPRYELFEITFQVDTDAKNFQFPFDVSPPAGIEPEIGITINALFTPDGWQTIYTQPAFYYQEFDDQVKSGLEWFYPTGNFSWKVRFTPTMEGTWQFKLVGQDSTGTYESPIRSFLVGPSTNRGFIRVSRSDARYFEFENGSYFPGLGYNMNFDHVSWDNPVLDNQENFRIMSENGIQLVRIWLSQWGIYDVSWNPWNAIDPRFHGQYIPESALNFEEVYPGSDVSMKIDASNNPCMFIGFMKASPAVKRTTNYRVRVRYKTTGVVGPRIDGSPYGFTVKTGDWLWGDSNNCHDPGTGNVITPYQSQDTPGWQYLEGNFTTGNDDFLPNLYLVVENANNGEAYIDYVWIEEDLGNGAFGPNIVTKPWMAHHYYMEQRNSYAFDKVLDLAKEYNIYLRPVIHEKNSWIFNRIDHDGNPIPDNQICWDEDPGNDPAKCPDTRWFFSNGREMSKVRWLQQAWWRYLQARWGYSTNIHSWELLNEGNPWSDLHYTLADEFGIYMHQFQPNHHLVSTSFWHSFPKNEFWANPEYGNVDFADIHLYIPRSEPEFNDAALASYLPSMEYGALMSGGAGKPFIRGETGFWDSETGPATSEFTHDDEGIWLHNFIWASINPGGMIESYWYEDRHIYRYSHDGNLIFDHRDQFDAFSNFMQDIRLNNGHYQDIVAEVSHSDLRAWGQKDLVNQYAHLWIQNSNHTWRNVVDGVEIPPAFGFVTISGFNPNKRIRVEWWDPYPSALSQPISYIDHLVVDGSGLLTLNIENLSTDIAVKIYPQGDSSNSP
jgi:hypothetical protein